VILVNLSGRGDKDVETVMEHGGRHRGDPAAVADADNVESLAERRWGGGEGEETA